MHRARWHTLTISVLIAALSACGGPSDPSTGTSETRVGRVAIMGPDPLLLGVGAEAQLRVEVDATGGASTTVTWTSNDGDVVAVDPSGRITAVALGTSSVQAASVLDASVADSITVSVVLDPPDPSTSTIAVSSDEMSTEESVVATVRVRDAAGEDLSVGGASVVLSTTLGSLTPVTDNVDGSYSATLTSSSPGTAVISGALNGAPITSGNATVDVTAAASLARTIWLTLDGTAGDETAHAVDRNSVGDIAITGTNAAGDWILLVYDSEGRPRWERVVLPAGGSTLYDVALDDDGNAYVAGVAFDVDGIGRYQYADAFLRKYDSDGDVVWTDVVYEAWGTYYYTAVEVVGDGDVIAGGRHGSSANADSPSEVVRRYSPGGTRLWTSEPFGSIAQSYIFDIAVSPTGSIFATTHVRTSPTGPGSYAAIRELTDRGSFVRQTAVSLPTMTSATAHGLAVAGTPDGVVVYAVGRGYSAEAGTGVWVAVLGDWSWTSHALEQGVAIEVGPDESAFVLAAGSETFDGVSAEGDADLRILRFGGAGTLVESRLIGSESRDEPVGLHYAHESGLLVVGNVEGSLEAATSSGGQDILIARLFE